MKLTLRDIEQAKTKFLDAKRVCDSMQCFEDGFSEQCNKVNRLLRQYRRIKGSYFNGNN